MPMKHREFAILKEKAAFFAIIINKKEKNESEGEKQVLQLRLRKLKC